MGPRVAYWGYIITRAQDIGLPTEQPEHLAFARLSVLCRVLSDDNLLSDLKRAWQHLVTSERLLLTRHFLADGIEQRAILLTFLPEYLLNSRRNPVVGLRLGLEVLCDLINQFIETQVTSNEAVATINLNELAEFTTQANSATKFQALASAARLEGNWPRVHFVLDFTLSDTDGLTQTRNLLKPISRRQEECMDALMERIGKSAYGTIDQGHRNPYDI